MKKLLCSMLFLVTFFLCGTGSAHAASMETVKVGLRYGDQALFSANLENAVGSGFSFGTFDRDREFIPMGETEETKISMTAAGTIYVSSDGTYSASVPGGNYQVLGPWHMELDGYRTFEEAQEAAWSYRDAYPACISGEYVVRIGCYDSEEEALSSGADGELVRSYESGILVTRTRSDEVLFEFEGQGAESLGVMPVEHGDPAVTWFKGYRYAGGFEYTRTGARGLQVVNVVDIQDYLKGVVPYEMPGNWPLEALKAQAVCARNFVAHTAKHQRLYGFDVCNTPDCQVYYGLGNSRVSPTERSDQAVDLTEDVYMYYQGDLVEAVYHSSNGGATEDSETVWGGDVPYLKGKADPYESMTQIPEYEYTVTYSMEELTWVLQHSGYDIGTVERVYISQRTPLGNVRSVTFVDTRGKEVTASGDAARMAFYSTTYGKNVRSLRYEIVGAEEGGGGYYVNNGGTRLDSLDGAAVISGSGTVSRMQGTAAQAITANGIVNVSASGGGSLGTAGDTIVIKGRGNGHHVGMSQYGAKAMAEQGFSYQEILKFYFTDVTIA